MIDFLFEKKAWSVVKDELLGCYFMPYVSKILHTYRPLVYVDCFAGKGKFDDGNPGSPLIALEVIDKCREITSVEFTQIEATFIDLNFADDLRNNLQKYVKTARMLFYFQASDKCTSVPFDVSHLNYVPIVDSAEIKTSVKARIENILEQARNGEI